MKRARVKKILVDNLLTLLIIASVVLSIVIGVIMRAGGRTYTPRTVMYVNFLGDIFLRMIRCLILPLIISSLIAAIAPLDVSLSKKIGTRGITYILSTTVLAVMLGITLVLTVKPGSTAGSEPSDSTKNNAITIVDTLLDLIRNIFPPNVVQATLQTFRTELREPENTTDAELKDYIIGGVYVDGTNMIGVVALSVIVAITMGAIKSKIEQLLTVILEFNKVMMKIIEVIIWLTPIGIFFLILAKFLEIADMAEIFGKLGLYVACACGGHVIHAFIILPTIFFAFTRRNPLRFMAKMGPAIITAFGTASSLATLPLSLKCIEEKVGVDKRVSRFMLPLGATINMNGTGLYQAIAAIFITQLKGIDLSIGSVIAVVITATAASVGTAGVPQAGMITLIMVLDSIGIPAEEVSLIIAVDWIVGRTSTCVNVLGDAYGAAIVESLSRKELQNIAPLEEESSQSSEEVEAPVFEGKQQQSIL